MRDDPRRLVVAIAEPAGAGKSTVARMLAARLGYDLLDTGAIYRVIALLARRRGIPWDDGPGVASLPEVRSALLGIQRALGARGGVVAEGRDIGTVVFPDAGAKFFLTATID